MRPRLPSGQYIIAAVTLIAGLAACGSGDDSTGPDTPAMVTIATGGTQVGVVGEELSEAIGVKVTNAEGKPIAGVPVSFSAAANSGSVSAATASTNASGIASVMWTLGTRAGIDIDSVHASVSQRPELAVVVTASATASAPTSMSLVSGDGQSGVLGTPAAEPLVVLVHDAFDNPNEGVVVHWSVEGGGTLSATEDTTDAAGKASVVWTLGAADNKASATIAALPGTEVAFRATLATSGVVTLLSISPDPLKEGESATITGTGFGATVAENKVWVDGLPASVTAASSTSLQITVPTFDCWPSRGALVRVAVGTDVSNALQHPLATDRTPLLLGVGEQHFVRDPAQFCVEFAETTGAEAYLIGVQSVSNAVTSMTPVTVRAEAAPGSFLAMAASPLRALSSTTTRAAGGVAPLTTPAAHRWARHRAAEANLRARERRVIARAPGRGVSAMRARPTVAAAQVPATVQLGDTIALNFPDLNGTDLCASPIPIKTVVRAVGSKGIWLEDVENPESGFTDTDFAQLSTQFDDKIYATDVAYFGQPTDIDGNGRVVIVTSKEVNKVENVLGFVISTDLVFSATDCPSSNEGEFYYGRAPDPAGLYESPKPYSVSHAKADAVLLTAHEFAHVIQFGRRGNFPGATAFQTIWEAEGQASFAQEVVGHAINGKSPGNNYGSNIAFNDPPTSEVNWYAGMFGDMATYYGFESQDSRVENAPEQCSWLDLEGAGNTGPCLHGREVYGVPWVFLRWLSDQFGPTFAGGEQGLHRALIENTHSGFATIEDVVGVPMDELLAQWAATLYVDDRVPSASSRLTLSSWNLNEIFSRVYPSGRLTPRERAFQTFTDAITVRGGSTGYFRISGGGRNATALALRNASGDPLPTGTSMRFWVVRLQ